MKFSIIIPTYNSEKYINECIKSVLEQDYPDWELLIIDDESTDNTLSILEKFFRIDKRIRIFRQKHLGPFFARQLGIKNSKGQYVLFLDSDDKLSKNCLRMLELVLSKYQPDIVVYVAELLINNQLSGLSVGNIYDSEKELSLKWVKEKLAFSDDLNSLCLKCFKKSLFKGDNTDYSLMKGTMFGEDKVQLLYPVTQAKKIVYIPYHLYYYRMNQDSLVHTNSLNNIKERIANNMYLIVWTYMNLWGINKEIDQQLFAEYYLKNYCAVYFNTRKHCNSIKEWIKLHFYPWEKVVNKDFIKFKYIKKLSIKIKIKLLIAKLRI